MRPKLPAGLRMGKKMNNLFCFVLFLCIMDWLYGHNMANWRNFTVAASLFLSFSTSLSSGFFPSLPFPFPIGHFMKGGRGGFFFSRLYLSCTFFFFFFWFGDIFFSAAPFP